MARLTITNDWSTSEPEQWVYVNGLLRSDLVCVDIQQQTGVNGSTAAFVLPAALYETDISFLQDAEVVVYVGNRSAAPLFRGFLNVEIASVGRSSGASVTAASPMRFLERVFFGQEDGHLVGSFRKYDPATGARTNWTLASIMQWLFNSQHLSSNWRSVVTLGRTAGLRRGNEDFPSEGITFAGTNYRQAIQSIVSRAGRCGVRERFTGTKTYVDFYEIGDSNAPARRVKGPTATQGPSEGAIIVKTMMEKDSRNIITRVIGEGQPHKYQVTVRTQATGGTETAPLIPGWNNTADYDDIDYGSGSPTADETAVLANPNLAKPNTPDAVANPDYINTFRLFQLPDVVRGMKILERNVALDAEGREIEIQVFRTRYESYAAPDPPEDGVDLRAGDREAGAYELIRGSKLLPGGFVLLPEPAVAPYQYNSDGTLSHRRQHVFVTLTVHDGNRDRLHYDTGNRGDTGGFGSIGTEGLVDAFVNENLEYQQLGIGALADSTGEEHELGTIWFDESAGIWHTVSGASPTLLVDHTEFLAAQCQQLLAERNRRPTQAVLEFPTLFRCTIGDGLLVDDDRLDGIRMQIVSVRYMLTGGGATMVVATDGIPDRFRSSVAPPPTQARPAAQVPAMAGAAMGGGAAGVGAGAQNTLSLDQFPIPMVAPTLPTKAPDGLMGPPSYLKPSRRDLPMPMGG